MPQRRGLSDARRTPRGVNSLQVRCLHLVNSGVPVQMGQTVTCNLPMLPRGCAHHHGFITVLFMKARFGLIFFTGDDTLLSAIRCQSELQQHENTPAHKRAGNGTVSKVTVNIPSFSSCWRIPAEQASLIRITIHLLESASSPVCDQFLIVLLQ